MRVLPFGIALVSLLFVGGARAVDLPGWNGDSRVRQVIYRADEVVRVEAQRGFATHIALGSNEHIQVVAPGDRDGWQVVAHVHRTMLAAVDGEAEGRHASTPFRRLAVTGSARKR